MFGAERDRERNAEASISLYRRAGRKSFSHRYTGRHACRAKYSIWELFYLRQLENFLPPQLRNLMRMKRAELRKKIGDLKSDESLRTHEQIAKLRRANWSDEIAQELFQRLGPEMIDSGPRIAGTS